MLCPGSFTHSAKLLSCPWERDPWGTYRYFSDSPYSTRSTEYPRGSPLGPGSSPKFLDEIFSLIQRNSQDEVLGVFMIKNLVINFKRVLL